MDELVQLQDGVLREQLAELQTARNNLGDIVAYCRGLYAEPNMSASHYGQAIEQSRTYASQSMSALAYQVNQCVHTLHELFQMHMGMVDEQCSDIGLLSEVSGAVAYHHHAQPCLYFNHHTTLSE